MPAFSRTAPEREFAVAKGDVLEITHSQKESEWFWGARFRSRDADKSPYERLRAYRRVVAAEIEKGSGPPLKIFSGGESPARLALSVYSMILNGYRPSAVFVFGDGRWSQESAALINDLLPFARIVMAEEVLEPIQRLDPVLANLASSHWFVLKTCSSLISPPREACVMDDDVFVLDRVDDALQAFAKHDLVFAPDADHSRWYNVWTGRERGRSLPTGCFNAGLYWIRCLHEPARLMREMGRLDPRKTDPMVWEQGFIAITYATESAVQLASERYFYPCWDGLPGGLAGYDYRANPCRFATIHFGGLRQKPGDAACSALAPQILGRATDKRRRRR